jgi:hypothetical protein
VHAARHVAERQLKELHSEGVLPLNAILPNGTQNNNWLEECSLLDGVWQYKKVCFVCRTEKSMYRATLLDGGTQS